MCLFSCESYCLLGRQAMTSLGLSADIPTVSEEPIIKQTPKATWESIAAGLNAVMSNTGINGTSAKESWGNPHKDFLCVDDINNLIDAFNSISQTAISKKFSKDQVIKISDINEVLSQIKSGQVKTIFCAITCNNGINCPEMTI